MKVFLKHFANYDHCQAQIKLLLCPGQFDLLGGFCRLMSTPLPPPTCTSGAMRPHKPQKPSNTVPQVLCLCWRHCPGEGQPAVFQAWWTSIGAQLLHSKEESSCLEEWASSTYSLILWDSNPISIACFVYLPSWLCWWPGGHDLETVLSKVWGIIWKLKDSLGLENSIMKT